MMKHDIASPSSMLVNEECFSRRLGRTSGYREALNLTRGSRIDGDPFLWRRRRRRKREVCSNVPTKNLSIRKIVKFHFVRGMERKFLWKFKSLDIFLYFHFNFLNLRFLSSLEEEIDAKNHPLRVHVSRVSFPYTEGDPVESIIYAIDTNLPRHERISILIRGPRVEGWDGDRCGTIPYISGGRFMEIRSAVSSRYNDRWPRYDRAVAPVPYVSLGVPPSTTYARPRRVRICGSLAGAPLNMEESGEITIRRVRSGLRTRISLSCKLLSLRGLSSPSPSRV